MSSESAIAYLREQLPGLDDPRDGMSPDGYAMAGFAAEVIREALVLLEPERWCPPHYYNGQSTANRGEAKYTCHMCGDSFVAPWTPNRGGYTPDPSKDSLPPGKATDRP